MYMKNNRGIGGKAVAEVNGNKKVLDSNFENGWGLYAKYNLVFDSETQKNVSVKISPRLEDNKEFALVGMMVSY